MTLPNKVRCLQYINFHNNEQRTQEMLDAIHQRNVFEKILIIALVYIAFRAAGDIYK